MFKSRKHLYIALFTAFALIVAFIYAALGGFREPHFSLEEVTAYELRGYEYRGRYTEQRLEDIFYSARALQEAIPGSTLSLLTYQEPRETRDSLHQFVGVLLPEGNAPQLPDTVASLSLPAQTVARAYLKKHALVMPRPDEVVAWLEEFAEDQGYRLAEGPTIEKYLAESELVVEVAVEKAE